MGFRGEHAGLSFFLEPVAFALDVDGGRMVQQPIEDSGGEHLVVEYLPPVDEALVGGDDDRSLLVPAAEQPEKQACLLAVHRQVSHLIEDEHLWVDQLLELPFEPVLPLGSCESGEHGLEGEKMHSMACFECLDPQGDRQMGLTDPWRPQEDHVLSPIDEAEARKLSDHFTIDTWLEGEIELLDRLDHGESCLSKTPLDPP